ncbi:MAG: hypothetical protein ABI912_05300 [Actinomycetota bacterium]
MNRMERRQARQLERALHFEQCPSCNWDFITGEGERACHYYGCPYLPEALDVLCPSCNYDFATSEGRPECGEPPSCEFATEEAPGRVSALREWTRRRSAKQSLVKASLS